MGKKGNVQKPKLGGNSIKSAIRGEHYKIQKGENGAVAKIRREQYKKCTIKREHCK